MSQLEFEDWPEAIKYLSKEVDRQNAELDALYTHMIAVRSLLAQSSRIDDVLLDKILEATAEKKDFEGNPYSATKIRELKSTSKFSAEIIKFPTDERT